MLAAGQAVDLGQAILRDWWTLCRLGQDNAGKVWTEAMEICHWAEQTGLCRRVSSLCYEKVLQKRLLAVWNADKSWLHQPEAKLRKIHVEANIVFQQYNFRVLQEHSQHCYTLLSCCAISKGTCQITLTCLSLRGTPREHVGVSWGCH